MGSGTCIATDGTKALIITCKHVTNRQPTATVKFTKWKTFTGKVIAEDSHADLAAIVIETTETPPFVPLAETHPSRGMPVWQVGYTHGQGPYKRSAVVDGYNVPADQAKEPRIFMPGIQVDGGDSGSGVFLQSEKALCGVVSVKLTDCNAPGPAGCVELKDIRRFVQSCWRFQPRKQPQPPDKSAEDKLAEAEQALRDALANLDKTTKKNESACDDAKLQALEKRLMDAIANAKPIQGAQGPAGKDGADGKDAVTPQIDELRKELADQRQILANLKGVFRVRIEPKR